MGPANRRTWFVQLHFLHDIRSCDRGRTGGGLFRCIQSACVISTVLTSCNVIVCVLWSAAFLLGDWCSRVTARFSYSATTPNSHEELQSGYTLGADVEGSLSSSLDYASGNRSMWCPADAQRTGMNLENTERVSEPQTIRHVHRPHDWRQVVLLRHHKNTSSECIGVKE